MSLPPAHRTAVALTIAGSDPSGGAGLQADLKTFHQFGVYGEAAITLLTVQNTTTVARVECMPGDLVEQQVVCVLADIPPAAIKIGALGCASIIKAVARALYGCAAPVVIDPVMVSKHGAPLMDKDAVGLFVESLLPRAALLTPNLAEAAALTGLKITDVSAMREAAQRWQAMGARAVLVKGGHLDGPAIDVLLFEGNWFEFPAERMPTQSTHGAGCTYSAAITAALALGDDVPSAVGRAKRFVIEAIRTAPPLGQGAGPLNHFAKID
jgi:hydroxymethylpyrimidine/phosphomethylpyrimidine kinase